MSVSESNSIACSLLIDMKGCQEIKKTKQGTQYSIDPTKEPSVIFKDSVGNKKEMKFKQNCTITITHEKILYNRDDVIIKAV
jgi:fibrillarin-like rRNA methylase